MDRRRVALTSVIGRSLGYERITAGVPYAECRDLRPSLWRLGQPGVKPPARHGRTRPDRWRARLSERVRSNSRKLCNTRANGLGPGSAHR